MLDPDYGKQMIVCRETGKKADPIPAHSEGAVGTSLSRQVEEFIEPHRALAQPPASNNCALPEIWQPEPKGLLQIFGHNPRDFPTAGPLFPPRAYGSGGEHLVSGWSKPCTQAGLPTAIIAGL